MKVENFAIICKGAIAQKGHTHKYKTHWNCFG